MTQKFTAEEVREAASDIRSHSPNKYSTEIRCSNMLTAYADTLSKPADSGRVGDLMALTAKWRERGRAQYANGLHGGDQLSCASQLEAALAAQQERITDGKAQWDEVAGILNADGDDVDGVIAKARALAAQGRGEAVNGDAPCAKCGSTSVDTGFECNDCGHDNAPPASPAGVPEVLAKLYAAASKGFHTSETCGPESKYLHKSKFQTMQELFDFEDAWRQAMLAAAPSATPEGGEVGL